MRSAELKEVHETPMERRLRHRSIICHMLADLIAHCGSDAQCAHEIGRRVMSGIEWAYTGKNSDHPNEEARATRQRLITTQLVGYLVANAAGWEDALQIGVLFMRGIEEAWAEDQRDLRLVC